MALFKAWCTGTKYKSKKKTFRTYSEKDGGRAAVLTQLGEAVRTHYDQTDRIADDVARLGYDGASEILRAQMPQSKRALRRSRRILGCGAFFGMLAPD